MKKPKKELIMILVLSMCVNLFAACGGQKSSSVSNLAATTEVTTDTDIPASATPAPSPTPTPTPTPPLMMLTPEQRNSINMLNYLTVLVQEIYESKNSRLYLESAYSELLNNTEPSIVDDDTLDEHTKIRNMIEKYRMSTTQRERLEFIYQQNNAQAIRSAIPNPMTVLNVVASGDPLKAIASLVYMAVDSASSYSQYKDQQELQLLKDSWALDDEEAANLHESRSSMFEYMVKVARKLPEEARGVTLSEDAVKNFVSWKNNTNLTSRIQWLESNQKTYQYFGDYWLELADSYYQNGDYSKCLQAVSKYEELDNSIFRYDGRFAQTLPFAIISAKETMQGGDLVETLKKYAELILKNTEQKDWSLRYFAARTYIDLYSISNDRSYLEKAYDVVLSNVNELYAKQLELNKTYLNDIVELKADSNAGKEEKNSIKEYNKHLKEQRKTELPPIYEPLLLNCELLGYLVDELNIDNQERERLDRILHPNVDEDLLFLCMPYDMISTFSASYDDDPEDVPLSYDGHKSKTQVLSIPAIMLPEGATVKAVANCKEKIQLDNWVVKSVDRNKSHDIFDFLVELECKTEKEVFFEDGDTIDVTITLPGGEESDYVYNYTFKAEYSSGIAGLRMISFEQVFK